MEPWTKTYIFLALWPRKGYSIQTGEEKLQKSAVVQFVEYFEENDRNDAENLNKKWKQKC